MSNTKFIYGFRKNLIDLIFIIRLYIKSFKVFGFNTVKEIRQYFKDDKCLFKTSPNRYVKSGKEIIAVPDMPPINSIDFIDYVISDIKWINHKQQPKLVFAIVCITSKCPFKCPYCYNSDLHIKEERLNIDTLTNTILALITNGVKSIYLSGGEPLMRWNDLQTILKKFKHTGTRFWLLSTGFQLTEERLQILKNEGLKGVMISLDSFDPKHINSVKGSQKAFDYAISAINSANKIGLFVALDCVFGKTLLQEKNFIKFIVLAGKKGAHFINCYSPRQMHHDLNNEYNNFGISEFEQLEILTTKNHKAKHYRTSPIAYAPDLWEAKRGCVGGKLFIYIDPAGNVKFCPFVDKSFGNINNDDIENILYKITHRDSKHICATNKLLS